MMNAQAGVAVTGLACYPVKSLAGVPLLEAELTPRGIRNDRRWMLVKENGRFITQREEHNLALLEVRADRDGFRITGPSGESCLLPIRPDSVVQVLVQVWKDELNAATGPIEAADFFSDFLGYRCIPVFMPENADRRARKFAPDDTPLSFADAYPGLITSESSLADLNTRSPIQVIMRRFRPNVVVAGALPYEEDGWSRIRIGSAEIACVKPCARCVLTTVDPDSGVSGKEPLKTLAKYRRFENDVFFGQNFVVLSPGIVKVGDEVSIVEKKPPPVFSDRSHIDR